MSSPIGSNASASSSIAQFDADALAAYNAKFGNVADDEGIGDDARLQKTSTEGKYETTTVAHPWLNAFKRFFTRNIGKSDADQKLNDISKDFYTSITSIFKGKMPPAVEKLLGVHVSGEGVMRPLTKRRIKLVTAAINELATPASNLNAGKEVSPGDLGVLRENGLIKDVDVTQAAVEGRVVEGKKAAEESVVSVGEEQTQFLLKEGFEVKPTSKNGNTLVNALLPQVKDDLDQKNEFNAEEEKGLIKRLHKQLRDENGLPDYNSRCHFTSYIRNGEEWKKIDDPVARDFGALDMERSRIHCRPDELSVKQEAANRSYRLLDLAARTYQRPVVLISMFDEDSGPKGIARPTAKKLVFGTAMNDEPICIYRDQDGNYSRLAYTAEGRKTAEYQEFTKQEVYEAPKERKQYYDIQGRPLDGSFNDTALIKEGKAYDSLEKAHAAFLIEKAKYVAEAAKDDDLDPDEFSWEGKPMAKKEVKPAEVKPKVEEVRKSGPSADEKEVKELHKQYQSARRNFVDDISKAYEVYVGKLPKPENDVDRVKRDLLQKSFEELRDHDAFNVGHRRDEKLILQDKDSLEKALSDFKKIGENFGAQFDGMVNEIASLRENRVYRELTEAVVDDLSERFGNVPRDRIEAMIDQSGKYYEKAAGVVMNDVRLLGENAEDLDNVTFGKTVDDLTELIEKKVATESTKIADEQRKAEAIQKRAVARQNLDARQQDLEAQQGLRSGKKLYAHLEQEAEKRQKLEAQQKLEEQQMRADELMPDMVANLKEKCANHAVSRFEEFYGKVAMYKYKTNFKPMQMPPSVKEAAEKYTAKVVEKSLETIRKAAMAGKSESEASSIDSQLNDTILIPAFRDVRAAVEADILEKRIAPLSGTINSHIATQMKRYVDLTPAETMTKLFGVWSKDVQQRDKFVKDDVQLQLQQAATEYAQKLREYAAQTVSLAGAPMPIDDNAIGQRQKECTALLTGLTQLRASIGEMTKGKKSFFGKELRKDTSEAANAFLAANVRPRLAQMVKSVVADGVTAKNALLKFASDLDGDGLNAFVSKDALQNKIKKMKI